MRIPKTYELVRYIRGLEAEVRRLKIASGESPPLEGYVNTPIATVFELIEPPIELSRRKFSRKQTPRELGELLEDQFANYIAWNE